MTRPAFHIFTLNITTDLQLSSSSCQHINKIFQMCEINRLSVCPCLKQESSIFLLRKSYNSAPKAYIKCYQCFSSVFEGHKTLVWTLGHACSENLKILCQNPKSDQALDIRHLICSWLCQLTPNVLRSRCLTALDLPNTDTAAQP